MGNEVSLNLSGWVDRRKQDIGPYSFYIIKMVTEQETEIKKLRDRLITLERTKVVNCCEAWSKAQKWKTDNKGYGPVLYKPNADTALTIGLGLPEVCFCPWCGAGKCEDIKSGK
jgi:hypothetical protein